MIVAALVLCFGFLIGENAAQNSPGAIILSPPKYTTVDMGQTVRMTCAAYGLPTPSISWTRLSENVAQKLDDPDSGYKVYEQTTTMNGTVFRVSVLEICGVTASESDEYICTADNAVDGQGIADSDAKFFLSVNVPFAEPPSIVVRPPPNADAVEYGTTIEAVCVAYGSPLPTITWTKQGCADITCTTNARVFSEIVTYGDVSYRKSILQLCSVDESNSGSYICSAMNGVDGEGTTPNSFTWELNVNGRPIAPTTSTVIVSTLSCPEGSMPEPSRTSSSTSSVIASQSVTVGRSEQESADENELPYQLAVGIEGVIIVILLIALAISILIAVKVRSSSGGNSYGHGGTEQDDTDMTYANLVNKMDNN